MLTSASWSSSESPSSIQKKRWGLVETKSSWPEIQPPGGPRWCVITGKMMFLRAKPESGAGRLRCLAGRFFFRSERAAGRWCTAARWAPGGWAADGLLPGQHASVCPPTSAKQKGQRGEWLFHFRGCGLIALALDFRARYDPSEMFTSPPLII